MSENEMHRAKESFKRVGMKKVLAFLAILLGCFCCTDSSVKNDEATHLALFRDLSSYYDVAERLEDTQVIDLTTQDSSEFLISGWAERGPHARGIWAVGLISELYFVTLNPDRDLNIALYCSPLSFKDSPKQSISIYLNQNYFIAKIELKSNQDKYRVTLPGKLLRFGKNFLSFEYAYAEKPSKVLGSKDSRNLSVRFFRIEFDAGSNKNARVTRAGKKLLQTPGSVINFYVYLPENAFLKFGFDNKVSPNIVGEVRVGFDDAEGLVFQYDNSGFYSLDLRDFQYRYACISISAKLGTRSPAEMSNPGDDGVVWSGIALYTKPVSKFNIDQPLNSPIGFNEVRKLRGYDVIYIVFDAFFAGHAGSYGYSRKTSPFFDQLASKGFLFENMFAPAPYTITSTASLLTSTYSSKHGMISSRSGQLDLNTTTFIDLLSEKDISTFLITGHGYVTGEAWGLSRAFEEIYFDEKYSRDSQSICEALEKIYLSRNGDKNRRKFIYIHAIPPHTPYLPPQKYRVFVDDYSDSVVVDDDILRRPPSESRRLTPKQLKYVKGMYDANILFADHMLSDIYSFLEENSIVEKAAIFVTSDHGEAFGQHGKIGHNTTLYDEMIHVPFLIVLPQNIVNEGKRISELTSLIDVGPTIMDIFRVGDADSFTGSSLLPLIFEGKKIRSYAYSEIPKFGHRAIRSLRFKLIKTKSSLELYDLEKDPDEKRNLTKDYPVMAGYLVQEMRELEGSTDKFSHRLSSNAEKGTLDKRVLRSLKDLGYIK